MTRKSQFLILATCLVLAACASSFRVISDYDADVDFSQYQTFSWIDPNPLIRSVTTRPLSPLVVDRLKADTRDILMANGLEFVEDPTQADLAVAFTIGSRDGLRISSYPTRSFRSGPRGRRDYRWGGYWGGSNVRSQSYTEGQLAVDLFSVAEARPIWHGTTTSRITRPDRENPDDLIRGALEAILKKFPPK